MKRFYQCSQTSFDWNKEIKPGNECPFCQKPFVQIERIYFKCQSCQFQIENSVTNGIQGIYSIRYKNGAVRSKSGTECKFIGKGTLLRPLNFIAQSEKIYDQSNKTLTQILNDIAYTSQKYELPQ